VRLRQRFQKIDGRLEIEGTELPLFDARLVGDRVRFTGLAAGRRYDFDGTAKASLIEGNLHVTGRPLARFRAERA
jgi:hypothetical protein